MGVVSDAVFRNQEDEHEITVTHDFPSMAEAERFVSPRTLRRATKADPAPASDPSVWFAEL
jgi:hypothetical protein